MIKNEQLVDNPHDLLLSLVDIGSIDAVDVLTACVKEMSDAECKRVLSSLCLPEACELEDEEDAQITPENPLDISTDDVEEVESPDDGEVVVDSEEVDAEDDDSDSLECRTRRIESRLKKIESILDRRAHSRTLEKRPSRRCTDEDLDDLDDIDDDDFSKLEIEDDEDEFDEGCSHRLENRLKRLERTLHNRCERRRCR